MLATARAAVVYGALLLGVLVLAAWPEVPRSLGIFQPVLFFCCWAPVGPWLAFGWLTVRIARSPVCA